MMSTCRDLSKIVGSDHTLLRRRLQAFHAPVLRLQASIIDVKSSIRYYDPIHTLRSLFHNAQ